MELLAPAGDMAKLKMAIHYGADAVYLAGKKYGLRTFAGNFDENQLKDTIEYAHSKSVKVYITVNIVPHDSDFVGLDEYFKYLEKLGADAVIVADLGILRVAKRSCNLDVHISTQANIINSETAQMYAELGAKRIILAREMSLEEIKQMRKNLDKNVEIEAFVHGAMCISHSGRCLLSNFFTGRDANRGACVQACRWGYTIREVSKNTEFPIEQDEHGTYILNSKDMCMIQYLDQLRDAGISSIKIEGRMKSEYYVANVTNAYRLALNYLKSHNNYDLPKEIADEVFKSSHREYCTGFYFGNAEQKIDSSNPVSDYEFVAVVLEDSVNGRVKLEMRNRFKENDVLELLSSTQNNGILTIKNIENECGERIDDVKNVQQIVFVDSPIAIKKYDILRRKVDAKSNSSV